MKIQRLQGSSFVIDFADYSVLVSYETPVAYYNKKSNMYHRTDIYYSKTTSKHINAWIPSYAREIEVKQCELESVIRKLGVN